MRQEAPQVKNSRLIHLERKLQEFKKTNPNCDAVLKCKIIAQQQALTHILNVTNIDCIYKNLAAMMRSPTDL